MPETRAQQRRPAAKKQASARKQVSTRKPRQAETTSAVDRTTQLSEDLLKSLEEGLRNALDAMRNFIETVCRTTSVLRRSSSMSSACI
jgi:hypothetical protein